MSEKLKEIEQYFDDQMIIEALQKRVSTIKSNSPHSIILRLYNMAVQCDRSPTAIDAGKHYLARAQFNRFRSRL